jgi:predicted nucleic acid-binding protein
LKLTFDSNVLLYAIDSLAGPRHLSAADFLGRAANVDCVLMLQSLGEFFNVATRKLRLTPARAGTVVDRWRAVFPVYAAGEEAFVRAVRLVETHGLSFWDAMLWATAKEAGCRFLLSEDLHDGHTLEGVTIVNPFASKNSTLLAAVLPPA